LYFNESDYTDGLSLDIRGINVKGGACCFNLASYLAFCFARYSAFFFRQRARIARLIRSRAAGDCLVPARPRRLLPSSAVRASMAFSIDESFSWASLRCRSRFWIICAVRMAGESTTKRERPRGIGSGPVFAQICGGRKYPLKESK